MVNSVAWLHVLLGPCWCMYVCIRGWTIKFANLPWQHWTKALVWFDDDMSAFHSGVVDLWQSLSEWHLLLSACFGVPPRQCRSLN